MRRLPTVIVLIVLTGLSASCRKTEVESEMVSAASEEVLGRDIVKWSDAFPQQTASNQKNFEEKASPTGYGGSVPFQRWDLMPEIKTNFAGIAFSKDYKEDRGHVYAWDDLFETERTGPNSSAACLTCKTSDIEIIFAEEGWEYASQKLDLYRDSAHAGIDCFMCHDPDTMHLRVIQPAYIEALEAQGQSASELSEQQLRVGVCAQCHSEYYFEPETTRVVFPWANGLSPEEMYAYYESEPQGFTGDYTNPISNTRLVKAQHPDFEMYQSGIHASAGVTCADCHMPRIQVGGDSSEPETITQHWVTSPLKTIESSCLTCHRGKNEEWMLERVAYIQDKVFDSLRRAGLAIEQAHDRIAQAQEGGVSDASLTESRSILREAQWYWDFVASANSTGFHNSELAMNSLNTAIDLAYKSVDATMVAAGLSL